MKIKKLSAILLAGTLAATSAVVAVNTIPVVNAAVEENNMVDLLKAETRDISAMNDFASLGDGFCLFNTKDGGTALVHLEKGEKGELSYSIVETDVNLSEWEFGSSNNERFVLSNKDGKKRIMSLDKKNNEAKTVYTFEGSSCSITDDNYVVVESVDHQISVIKPDGTKIKSDMTIEFNSDLPNLFFNVNGKNYIAYYMDVADDNTSYEIYGLGRDGKWTKAVSAPINWLKDKKATCSADDPQILGTSLWISSGDYVVTRTYFKDDPAPNYDFIDLGKDEFYIVGNSNNFYEIDDYGMLSDPQGTGMCLFNPRTKEYMEYSYHARTLDGGETYTAANDTYTGIVFVDKNNKKMFGDDFEALDAFCGDYAPVVKDGMGYLIDRKGNRVSEKIPARWAKTYSEDLFSFEDTAGNYTLVYVDNGSSSSSTTTPESSSSSSSSSSTTTPESSSSSSSTSSTTTPESSSSSSSSSSTTTPESSSSSSSSSSTTTPESSSSTTTESKNFSDSTTKVEVSVPKTLADGLLKEVTLVVDQVKNNNANDKTVTYDISFKDKDGKAVSLDKNTTEITVKLPVPEALKDEKKLYVYYVDDNGKYTDMKATVKDGFIEFKTTHFSKYLITTDGSLESTDKENIDTGFGGIAMTLGLVALAGAAVVAARKRK